MKSTTFRDALYPYWLKRWISLPLDWHSGPHTVNGRDVYVNFVGGNHRELSFQTNVPLVVGPDDDREKVRIEFARMTLASGMWTAPYQDTIVPSGLTLVNGAEDAATIYPMLTWLGRSFRATDKPFGMSDVKSVAPNGFSISWSLAGHTAPQLVYEHDLQEMLPQLIFDGTELRAGDDSALPREELLLASYFLFHYTTANGVSVEASIYLTTLDAYDAERDRLRRPLTVADVEEYTLRIKVERATLRPEWELYYQLAYDLDASTRIDALEHDFMPRSVAQQIYDLYSRVIMDFQPELYPLGAAERLVPHSPLQNWQVRKRATVEDDFYPLLEQRIRELTARSFVSLSDDEVYMLRDMLEKQRVLRLRKKGLIECRLCPAGIASFCILDGRHAGAGACKICVAKGLHK